MRGADGLYVEIPLLRAAKSKLMCIPICDPAGWQKFREREGKAGELGATWKKAHKYFLDKQQKSRESDTDHVCDSVPEHNHSCDQYEVPSTDSETEEVCAWMGGKGGKGKSKKKEDKDEIPRKLHCNANAACKFWKEGTCCAQGERCRYMHDALDLFQPEDNDYHFEEARLEIPLKDKNGRFLEGRANPRDSNTFFLENGSEKSLSTIGTEPTIIQAQ